MQNIPYQTFKTAEEAIASKAEHIIITTRCDRSPLSGATHIKALKLVEPKGYDDSLDEIANMPNLEILDLSEQRGSLPDLKMPNLKYVDLSNVTYVENEFSILANLPKLETLVIKNCQIFEVKNQTTLEQVTKLDIRGNQYVDLLEFLKGFPNLKELMITELEKMSYDALFELLSHIPTSCKLHLALENNRRKKVPNSIKKIKALTSLSVSIEKLKDCKFLAELKLEELSISGWDIDTNNLFENRESLKRLDVRSLPEEILQYQALEELNFLLNNPEELRLISQLPNFKRLFLYFSGDILPQSFANLSHLESIFIGIDKHIVFPKEVAFFTKPVFRCKPPFAEKINGYIQKYAKDETLSDELKLKYFAFLLDQKSLQEEIMPYPFENPDPKAVFFINGGIDGYTKKEITKRFKEYGYKVSTKLNDKVTHIVLGKNIKEDRIEELIANYTLIIEAHLKKLFIDKDKPFLMEKSEDKAMNENAEAMNENIIQLLISDTSQDIGLAMMEEGGATKQTLAVLYVFLADEHYDKDKKRKLRKVFKKYASAELKDLLKNKKTGIFHPDLDAKTYFRIEMLDNNDPWITKKMVEIIGWEYINEILNKHEEVNIYMMSDLGLKEFPKELIPCLPKLKRLSVPKNEIVLTEEVFKQLGKLEYLSLSKCNLKEFPIAICTYLPSLERLTISNNDIEVLPKEMVKLKKLRTFDMENCKIKDVSILLELESLEDVYLKNNPLKVRPKDGRFYYTS